MSAPWDADHALNGLHGNAKELEAWQGERLTEADTRAKIIDILFKDVLGWTEGAIRREERCFGEDKGGYIDYTFASDANRFIVEAKKAGEYFEMPSGIQLRARSAGVLTRSPSLIRAISQVREYCLATNVPVGVVSNGLQLAVVRARAGSQHDYDVLLFDGIRALDAHFVLFWNLLSPLGCCEAELRKALDHESPVRLPPQFSRRILDDLPRRDEAISRNPIDAQLRPHIQRYFSDMTGAGKDAVLRECFCDTPRQRQYEKQLRVFIEESAVQVDKPVIPVVTTRRSAGTFERNHRAAVAAGPTVFLLVGGVGVGKTTFIHRFYRFILDEAAREKTVWLYVDFTRVASQTQDAAQFVVGELLRELRQKYPSVERFDSLQLVYESEIARMREGPWHPLYKDHRAEYERKVSQLLEEQMREEEAHVGALLRHLAKKGCGVCLVFDNADQLSTDFQKQVILLAFQKAKVYESVVMLALRDETYWRQRTLGPLDPDYAL